MTDEEISRAATDALAAQGVSGLIVLYLFGSAAEGRLRAESDIDLAFLAMSDARPLRVFDAAQALATVLHRDVDLVDLSEASTVMRAQVIGKGRRIHVADEYQANLFEAHALSDYARMQEERSAALRAFADGYDGR